MNQKSNIYDLSNDDLAAMLQSWGEPKFRAGQIRQWLYEKHVSSFDSMENISKALRQRLQDETTLGTLEIVTEQVSNDGTTKRLYKLPDGQLIESVLMFYDDNRRTACISTQAGCGMGCVFCATGHMGLARNLTASEIFEQAMFFASELANSGERLSNVVLMGMGEPFHNYDESLAAIRRLMSDLNIGARHITVSTVGLVPQILQFAEEGLQVRLAISLHAADDETRSALIPVNKRWPIEELIDACRYYTEKTSRRITFEWALIQGETDTKEQAQALGRLLQRLSKSEGGETTVAPHVNLIRLNPTKEYKGRPADTESTDEFIYTLTKYGIEATVRVRRGLDIAAGCGQLKAVTLD
jgi:23S rRNA (adenine2503-C2)-methyltransferase